MSAGQDDNGRILEFPGAGDAAPGNSPEATATVALSRVSLDPDQQAAVNHRDGACLVLAGPGSGKTRCIVERFIDQVSEGVRPTEQVVLTYSVSAAEEMRTRAEGILGVFDGDVPLTNFHSFARRVVRRWGWLDGITPAFSIADAAERWIHMEAVLDQTRPHLLWNALRPYDMIDDLLTLFKDAKQSLITPAMFATWADTELRSCIDPARAALLERHREAASVYAALNTRFMKYGVLDHDDTILYAEHILRTQAAAQRDICHPVRDVMVDEYQDTNFAQARLVEAIIDAPLSSAAGGRPRSQMVVADDDQSIYKFQGASLANLERFARRNPGHRVVLLSTNYRSVEQIVTANRMLIDSAPLESRRPKTISASRGVAVGSGVEVWRAPDQRAEVVAIAAEIKRLVDSGVDPGDVAWLFKRHASMQPAVDALNEAGVPYQVRGGRGYFKQPEIKLLLNLLTAIADPDDSQCVLTALTLPTWAIGNAARLTLARLSKTSDMSILELLVSDQALGLEPDDRERARTCAEFLVEMHGRILTDDAREIIQDAWEQTGFEQAIDYARDIDYKQSLANINKFIDLVEHFDDRNTDLRLPAVLGYMSRLRESRASDELAPISDATDGVSLLTIHAAKGLEWSVVVMSGLTARDWPSSGGFPQKISLPDELVPELPPPGDGHVNEERRLFYVGRTRARNRLLLTWPLRAPTSFRDEQPTRFLDPLLGAPDAPAVRILPFVAAAAPARRQNSATMIPAEHLSASPSDLKEFRECPRRYAYSRVVGLPKREDVRQWYGTLVHSVLHAAGAMRRGGQVIDADRIRALWDHQWALTPGRKRTYAHLREYGAQQLAEYVSSPAWTDATVAEIESDFRLALTSGAIPGRIDRLDLAPGDWPTVVDYKTGTPRTADSLSRDIQVRSYAVGVAQQRGVSAINVEFHYLQDARQVRVTFDEKKLDTARKNLSALLGELARARATHDFPAKPNHERCGRCDFRTSCTESIHTVDRPRRGAAVPGGPAVA